MKELEVTSFSPTVVGPSVEMLGPISDGGTIVAHTAPGCWGPMITPSFTGGHEVTQPVAIENATIGDCIAVKIKHIEITSQATASGVHESIKGRFIDDPTIAAICPGCGTVNPPSRIENIGPKSIRCVKCGADVSPFCMSNGYTIVFDHENNIGVTVDQLAANEIAKNAYDMAGLPELSKQNPILVFAVADLQGVATRLRPFIGNIGTTPSIDIPASSNAGDLCHLLVGKQHKFTIRQEDLNKRTDAHMDIDSVREGSIVICPVKIDGGGLYIGDVHAMQGDGEIAGHTTDVSARVTITVNLIKRLRVDGPILLPLEEDLPFLAKPHRGKELITAKALGHKFGQQTIDDTAPIQIIGSGNDLNKAVVNGLERMADLMDMSIAEVKNRVTLTGGIEIGRLPGVVTVTMLAPMRILEQIGLAEIIKEQYKI